MKKFKSSDNDSQKTKKNLIPEKNLKNIPGGTTEVSEINSFNKNKWHLHK